jgi:hypothetical protein
MGGGIVFCAAFASASPSKNASIAAAQTGDVLTVQESAGTPPQLLINNPPSGSLSVGNLRGGRVTVLGVTEETILPGTTKGP